MEKIVVSCLESRIDENQSVYSRFLLGPFLSGHAVTVATALRRSLLSEVKNIAITALHIQGVTHEFSTIVGIRESVLELSLNFQQIILSTQIRTRNVQVGYLHVQGPAIVHANDLKLPDGIECVNPTQYIATISTEGVLVVKFLIGEKRSFLKSNTSTLNSKKIKEAKAYSVQLSKSLLSHPESDPPRLFRLLRNHSLPTGAIACHKPKVCATFDKTNLLRTGRRRGSFEQSKGEVVERLAGTTFWPSGSGQVAFGDSKSKPNLVLQEQSLIEQNLIKVELPFDNCRNEVPVAPKGLNRAVNKPAASAASVGSDQLLASLGVPRPWIALPERRFGSSRLTEHSSDITTVGVESNLDQSANGFFDEFNSEVCLRTIIPLDPIFTPVYQVNFGIERDDLSNKKRERVIMEIWTNGSIHPRQAINEAALSTISIFSKLRKTFQLDSHSLSLFPTSIAPVSGLARGSRLPKTKSILKGRQVNDDPSESLKQESSMNFRRFALAKPSRTRLKRTSSVPTNLISSLGFVRLQHPVPLLLQNFGKSHVRSQAFLLEQSFGLKARFLKGHRVVLSKALARPRRGLARTSEEHTLKKTFLPSFKAVLGIGTPFAYSTVGLTKSSILGVHSYSASLVAEQPKSNSRLPAPFAHLSEERLPERSSGYPRMALALGSPLSNPCSASLSKSYAHSSFGRVGPYAGNRNVVPVTNRRLVLRSSCSAELSTEVAKRLTGTTFRQKIEDFVLLSRAEQAKRLGLRPFGVNRNSVPTTGFRRSRLLSFAEQVPRLKKKLSMQPKPILFLIKYKTFSFTRNALRVFGCRNEVLVSRVATSKQQNSSFLLPLTKQAIRVKMAQVFNSCLPLMSKKSEPGLRFRFTGTQAITTVEGSHQFDVKQALLSLTRNALKLQNCPSSTYGSSTETDSSIQDAPADVSLSGRSSGIGLRSIAPLGRLWLRSNLKKQFGFFQFACNGLRAGHKGGSTISHTFFADRAFLLTRLQGVAKRQHFGGFATQGRLRRHFGFEETQGFNKHQDGLHCGFVQALPITDAVKLTESTEVRSTLPMPERNSGYESEIGSTKLLLSPNGRMNRASGRLVGSSPGMASLVFRTSARSSCSCSASLSKNRAGGRLSTGLPSTNLGQPELYSGNKGEPRAQHGFAEGKRGVAGTTFRQPKRQDLGWNIVPVSRFATSVASETTLARVASTPVGTSIERSSVTGRRTVMSWEKRWMEPLEVCINRATLLPNQSRAVARFVRAAFKKKKKDLQGTEPTDLARFARGLLSQPRRRLAEQASYLRSTKRSWPKPCLGWPRKGLKPPLNFTTFSLMMTKVPPLCLSSGFVTLASSTSEVAPRLQLLARRSRTTLGFFRNQSVAEGGLGWRKNQSVVASRHLATSNKTEVDQRCEIFKPGRLILEQGRRKYLEEREFAVGAGRRGSSAADLFGSSLDGNLCSESEVASILTGTPFRPFQFTTQAGITLPLLSVSSRFIFSESNEPVALVRRTINQGLPERSFDNRSSEEGGRTGLMLSPNGRNYVPASRSATSAQHSQKFQFCARVTPRSKRLSILYSSNLDKMSFLSSDLANFSLSLKTYTFLKKKGKKNIASLLEYSPKTLFSFLNGDKIMFHEIERCLSLLGLPFKERF